MKVALTGATGFVGGHVARALIERGDQVRAMVRSRQRAAHLEALGVTLVNGDLANPQAMRELVAGVDAVIHGAALTGALNEAEFLLANRDGTASLAAAVGEVSPEARLVYISSMAAGGPAGSDSPRQPGDPDQPVTMYGRSKLAGELALRESGVSHVNLRASAVYGPGDTQNFLTVFRAAPRGVLPVFGDGSQQVCLVHVADLTTAVLAAAEVAQSSGTTWYINHPEVLTTASVVRLIAAAMGRSNVRLVRLPPWMTRSALQLTGSFSALFRIKTILHADKAHEFLAPAWTADPTPFMKATGWQPQWDAARGLAATALWYRQNRLV